LQSRNNITVNFVATAEALNLLPNDIISITHNTPNWTNKEFRVDRLNLTNNGTVVISCNEYQASTYTWSHLTAPTVTTDTNLPNPNTVTSPSALALNETVYSSIASGGKKIRSTLTWAVSSDYYNEKYDFSYKKSADTAWTEAGSSVGNTGVMNDFEIGTYDFRVRAKNSIGAVSSWVELTNQDIIGKITAPENVSNFNVSINSADANTAVAVWDAPTDADLIGGGHIEIRNLMTGATTWDDAEVLTTVGGSTTSVLLPLMEGNYVAKWIGSDGLEAVDYMESGLGTVFWTNTTDLVNYHPLFEGTKTNLFVADNDGEKLLKFVSEGNWDNFGLIDSIATKIDEQGGTATDGQYVAAAHDLGKVLKFRAYTKKVFTSGVSDQSKYMDTWGKIDSRNSWDEVVKLAGVTTHIRTTVDDPASVSATWTAYKQFQVADVQARGVQLKVRFLSDQGGAEQFRMSELGLLFDMKSKVYGQIGQSASTVSYSETFHTNPVLLVTPKNMVSGDYMTISNETATGFDIAFHNSAGGAVTRQYNYLAEGVG
jgi:hypothetical protein